MGEIDMKLRLIGLLAAALLLAGCKSITTTATIYQGKNHMERGTVVAIPVMESNSDSLEYKTIGDYILTKLAAKGYTPTEEDQKPEFKANFQYSISKPIKNLYKGLLFYEFNHSVEIEIYKQVAGGKPDKKYELKAAYLGKCGNVNPQVVLRMIDAIFLDFPGVNGRTNKHRLNLDQGESGKLLNHC